VHDFLLELADMGSTVERETAALESGPAKL
jgi:hypothetical protein